MSTVKKNDPLAAAPGNLPARPMSNPGEVRDGIADATVPGSAEPVQTEREDADLADVGAAAKGDPQAFERLVLKYQDKIFNLAYRLLASREEAEELTQEIFLKVYRQVRSFRGDSLFSTWLYQVASNHCKNRLKYLQRRKQGLHDSLDAPIQTEEGQVERSIPDNTKIPETLVAGKELQRLVSEKIATLPEDYRMVVVLRDIQGLSYEEIAEITGTVEGTVKSRLHRARMELKERLKKYFDPSMLE
jgi:RNA polymerase sigma-70 factor, ECF subfamily